MGKSLKTIFYNKYSIGIDFEITLCLNICKDHLVHSLFTRIHFSRLPDSGAEIPPPGVSKIFTEFTSSKHKFPRDAETLNY